MDSKCIKSLHCFLGLSQGNKSPYWYRKKIFGLNDFDLFKQTALRADECVSFTTKTLVPPTLKSSMMQSNCSWSSRQFKRVGPTLSFYILPAEGKNRCLHHLSVYEAKCSSFHSGNHLQNQLGTHLQNARAPSHKGWVNIFFNLQKKLDPISFLFNTLYLLIHHNSSHRVPH